MVHYSLRESLLRIIIKGSFTENFYPLQAFCSGETENFSSSVMGSLFFCVFFEKNKNNALQNGFFSHENALYRKGGAVIINSCI